MHLETAQPTAQVSAWKPSQPNPVAPGLKSRGLAATTALGRKLDASDPAVAKQAAAQMSSELFFKPLLAEMRKMPFGKTFAHGGRTEEIFAERLDEEIADRVAGRETGFTRQLLERLTAGPGHTLQRISDGGSAAERPSRAEMGMERSRPAAAPGLAGQLNEVVG